MATPTLGRTPPPASSASHPTPSSPQQIPNGDSIVITFPSLTTSLEVGCSTGMTTYYTRNNVVSSEVLLTIVTQTTIIAISAGTFHSI